MYNKVEICGINTSKLPVLSEERKKELLKIIHTGNKKQSLSARDEMINGKERQLPLLFFTRRRMCAAFPPPGVPRLPLPA